MVSTSEPQPGNTQRTLLLLGGCLFMLLCMACLGFIGVGGGIYAWIRYQEAEEAHIQETVAAIETANRAVLEAVGTLTPAVPPTAVPTHDQTLADVSQTPNPFETPAAVISFTLPVPAQISQHPIPPRAFVDLEQLYITDYPAHDYYETAVRLSGFTGPRSRTTPPVSYQLGDTHTFFNDMDTIEATLTAVTEHTYFWVENGLNLDAAEVAEAANRFENDYYGRLETLFGSLWSPGVDNDPRFSVLHVSHTAADELGYFRNEDEYLQELFNYSNEQEIIYLNMGELNIAHDLYYATLVHEVQHLIQWHVDPGESAWLNEGLSQLAEIYLGFADTADTIDYLEKPETRLNTWTYDDESVYAHYAGAYLFAVYLWEQLGETAVQELSRHPANGMAGVRAILQGYAPETTLEQFTANWAAANYLDNNGTNTNKFFFYEELDLHRPAFFKEAQSGQGLNLVESLDQFGVHYIDLNKLRGPVTVSFAGNTTVSMIDAPITNDNVFWYAPAVDEMNARLTAVFDLSRMAQATLTYAVWYDLEEDYDFAYVSLSTDSGQTWQTLRPEHGQRDQYGYGYNGRSAAEADAENEWLKESISLDDYVGQPVTIRFDVLTDSGITGQGFAIDNINVTGHQTATFTDGPEGWLAEGFVLTGGLLPQQWSVLLIEEGVEPKVTTLPLDTINQGQWLVEIGKGGGVLVIMPQTPFVNTAATYWLNVTQ